MTTPRPTTLLLLLLVASTLCMSQPLEHPASPLEPESNSTAPDPATNTEAPSANTPTRPSRGSRVSKRSYYPSAYSNYIPPQPFQSIAVWKPPVYQLSRPYYVPVFGAPGHIPLYYPPQPLYLNPGTPQVNPNFMGPTYLPPVTQATPEDTTMRLDNRFNNDNDDRPVWDVVNSDTQPSKTVPTRPPKRPGAQSTSPPLVHNGGGGAVPPPRQPPTSRPGGGAASRPSQQSTPAPAPAGPSKCVWAIISCCSATSEIRYNCFEQLGCRGAFWDRSPCEGEFAEAAIQQALNYYDS